MSQSREQQNLRKYWDHWIGVVQSAEARHPGSISGDRYSLLYQKLLEACDAKEKEAASHAAVSDKLRNKIRKLVEPWVTLDVLLHSERTILQDLLRQCQEINDVMHPHLIHVPRKFAYLILVICCAMALVGLDGLFSEEPLLEGALGEWFGQLQGRAKFAIGQTTVTDWLAVVAVVVVIFGASLAYGTRKS